MDKCIRNQKQFDKTATECITCKYYKVNPDEVTKATIKIINRHLKGLEKAIKKLELEG